SDGEVEIIYTLAHALLGKDFHTSYPQEGTRKISWEDMLFVAPYNHQVSKLQQALGPHAQVGSVDKFQGQEAPIVFLSMCTSNAADSPRGLEFLFDRNRLNVAVSRAQTLAIVVGHPNLQLTPVNSIDQMEAVNLFCALVQRD
ncbi:MAG TPA: helicase, partial [Gammaproteobacteria bacterium]|nr:helicase [Gammaproteobacteria bacterium]